MPISHNFSLPYFLIQILTDNNYLLLHKSHPSIKGVNKANTDDESGSLNRKVMMDVNKKVESPETPTTSDEVAD